MQQMAVFPPALFLFFPFLLPLRAGTVSQSQAEHGGVPSSSLGYVALADGADSHSFSTALTLSPLTGEVMVEVMGIDVLRITAWRRPWEDGQVPMSEKRQEMWEEVPVSWLQPRILPTTQSH